MNGKIRFGTTRFEAEIDSEDPEVERQCQRTIDNAAERIEAAITEAVCKELRLILPGITAECNNTWVEGDEDG
jgi:hypothetical protein